MPRKPNVNNTGGNSPEAFAKMSQRDQLLLTMLIDLMMEATKSLNRRCSSYRLKHLFEPLMPGGYISNGEMKGAMLHCGFYAADRHEMNWIFNISSRSPILRLSLGELLRKREVIMRAIEAWTSK